MFCQARDESLSPRKPMVESQQQQHEQSPDKSKANKKATPKAAPSPISSRIEALYQHAKEKDKKLQMERERTEMLNCTFKPKINVKNKKIQLDVRSTGSPVSRFDKLYQNAADKQKKIEQQRIIKENSEVPTFKPELVSKKGRTGSGENLALSGQARIDKLYTDALLKQEKKDELNASYLDQECTFAPLINDQSEFITQNSAQGVERFKQLYEYGKIRQEKLKQAQSRALPSFQPEITHNDSIAVTRTPLFPNKEEMMRLELEKEMKKLQHELQDCTFKPTIESDYVPLNNNMTTDVHTRLYEEAELLREKQIIAQTNAEIEEMLLLQNSKIPLSLPAEHNLSLNLNTSKEEVFDRLYEDGLMHHQTKIENEVRALQRRMEEENLVSSECTFQPEINQNIPAESIEQQNAHRLNSSVSSDISQLSTFDRLYVEGYVRNDKRELESKARTGLDLQCTFHPKINERSKEIVAQLEQRGNASNNSAGYMSPKFIKRPPPGSPRSFLLSPSSLDSATAAAELHQEDAMSSNSLLSELQSDGSRSGTALASALTSVSGLSEDEDDGDARHQQPTVAAGEAQAVEQLEDEDKDNLLNGLADELSSFGSDSDDDLDVSSLEDES